jgi:DNA processing protein
VQTTQITIGNIKNQSVLRIFEETPKGLPDMTADTLRPPWRLIRIRRKNRTVEELLYQIALTKIPLVGPVTARTLVSHCGGVREIFSATRRQLLAIPGIGEQTARHILHHQVLPAAEKECTFLEKHHIRGLFFLSDDYPHRLRHCNDAPVLLYYAGQANLNGSRIIGIIGTRTPTPQGLSACEELVDGLKPYQPVIVSGLAYGIDAMAHRKSLSSGLPTVGVLGHGLSSIYPAQHRKMAAEMMELGGLLTEFTSDTPPDRENFPMRNRIVAGMCDAIVVVETATRGGSIITALQANSYNRDVFALPGRIKDPFSGGCHYLIKNNLAGLVENADDIVRNLRWPENTSGKETAFSQPGLFDELPSREKDIVDMLREKEESGIDEMAYRLKISGTELASLLLNLEFKGMVRSLPGKRYILC